MAFMSKIERGITFNFMRIDAEKEPEFAGLFTENPAEPMIAIMNPGKRKRFLAHEGDVMSSEALTGTLDKILGGDARFKAIKENKLPAF